MAAVYTSITLSYLAKARVLARSVKRNHPDFAFYLVLAEPAPASLIRGVADGTEPFDRIVSFDELEIPRKRAWIFGHDVVEACTAVKAPALCRLQQHYGERDVIYLDPDVVVFHSLAPIVEMLREASIVLTPHCSDCESDPEAIIYNEISSLAHGVYNLGFLAVAADDEGRRFAEWWEHRLYHFCHDDIPRGLFVDQRWCDMVPAQFDRVKILRDPAFNAASWNVTQRQIAGDVPDALTCNGRPLRFYHFSGVNSGTPERIHQMFAPRNRTLREMTAWYRRACEAAGESSLGKSVWHFARYDNGQPITRPQRLYYRSDPAMQDRFPDPFSTGEGSYYHWLVTRGPGLEAVEELYPQTLESLQQAAGRLRRIESTRAFKVYAELRRWARTVYRRAS